MVYRSQWNQQLYLNTYAEQLMGEQLMEEFSEFYAQQIAEIILRRCAITQVVAQDERVQNSQDQISCFKYIVRE